MTAAERFWVKVDKAGPVPDHRPDLGPCWVWTAALNGYGYGQFFLAKVNRRTVTTGAHRWSWEQANGPVPEGLQLDHLCRVRACVNPDHLEPVTPSENIRRGVGPAMRVARADAQTHCKRGHLLAGANLVPNREGHRTCRECRRKRDRENKARYRAARRAA